jgi:hypothetical protein
MGKPPGYDIVIYGLLAIAALPAVLNRDWPGILLVGLALASIKLGDAIGASIIARMDQLRRRGHPRDPYE